MQSAVGTTGKLHLSASQLTFSPFPPAFLLPLFLCRGFSPQKSRGSAVRRGGGGVKKSLSALCTNPLPGAGGRDPQPRGASAAIGTAACPRSPPAAPSGGSGRLPAPSGAGAGRALPRGRRRCPAAPVLLGPRLRAAPEPEPEQNRGRGAEQAPLLTPQPRFIPGAGRSLSRLSFCKRLCLRPSPEKPGRLLRGGEARSAEPPPSRGVPAAESHEGGWGRG